MSFIENTSSKITIKRNEKETNLYHNSIPFFNHRLQPFV